MRARRLAPLLALILSAVSVQAQAAWQTGDIPDQVLVTWRAGLDRLVLDSEAQRLGVGSGSSELKLREALHAQAGTRLKRSSPMISLDQVSLPPGSGPAAVDRAIEAYLRSPLVAVAETDKPLGLAAICPAPDDTLYASGRQWYLSSTAWPQALKAWCDGDIVLNATVTVAVIDTGVDAHPDLAPQLLSGNGYVSGEPGTDDTQGHGTFCSGLIAATAGNANGMAGAFFDPAKIRILPVKVLDNCGGGSMGDLAAAITWAVGQGARVISMSIEGPNGVTALENAVNEARRREVVLVAASGNDNSATAYPAAYSAVISVGALDHLDQKAYYSNFGKLDISAPGGDNDGRCPCLAAPAGCSWEVWSLDTLHPSCPERSFAACALASSVAGAAGTSFAAPLVAAAAALLISQDPSRRVSEVYQRLLQGASPTALGSGYNNKTGWGKLSFYGSLTLQGLSGPGVAIKAWNWPNPFSPAQHGLTTFTLMLPGQQPATIQLFDSAGDLVKRWELPASATFAGMNLLTWDGRNGQGMQVANGSYLLVLESAGSRAVNRVAVLK